MGKDKKKLAFSDSIPKSWVDAEYSLMPREVQSLDRVVRGVIRTKAIIQKYFPTISIPKGNRYHKIALAQELREPIFTDDFMQEDLDEVKKKEVEYWLAAMHKDFRLNMIDIDASRNQKYYNVTIETLNIREATKTIADYKERVLFRGYDILDKARTAAHPQGIIDTSVAGLVNPPSGAGTVNAFDAATDNAGVDSAGDGALSIGDAMSELVDDLYYGPYVFMMTSDILGQLGLNFNATTQLSDIERMHGLIDIHGNKILEAMDTSNYLIKAQAVADNGSMLMFQRKTPDGEPTVVIGEAYPVAHYPTQMSSLGIKGKVLWMGATFVIRPKALALETAVNLIA